MRARLAQSERQESEARQARNHLAAQLAARDNESRNHTKTIRSLRQDEAMAAQNIAQLQSELNAAEADASRREYVK